MKNIRTWLIFIGLLLLVMISFLGGYLVFDHFSEGKSEESKVETLSLKDPNVFQLYNYVSFGQDSPLYTAYLLKNKNVTVDNFTDTEKHFFGLQFIKASDVMVTGVDPNGSPTFTITDQIYQTAMTNFFGSKIAVTKDSTYTFITPFTIENSSWVRFTYDNTKGLYTGIASGIGGRDMPIKTIYKQLLSATKSDDTITIKAKFIFVTTTEEQVDLTNTYDYKVYADYAQTILLDTKTNVSEADALKFSITPYLGKANLITYTFKLGSDNLYYFNSSTVEK